MLDTGHPRSDILRAIRLGHFSWAFTLAQVSERDLSEGARISICKALAYDEGSGRHIEMGLGDQLALKWGIYRIVTRDRRRSR